MLLPAYSRYVPQVSLPLIHISTSGNQTHCPTPKQTSSSSSDPGFLTRVYLHSCPFRDGIHEQDQATSSSGKFLQLINLFLSCKPRGPVHRRGAWLYVFVSPPSASPSASASPSSTLCQARRKRHLPDNTPPSPFSQVLTSPSRAQEEGYPRETC